MNRDLVNVMKNFPQLLTLQESFIRWYETSNVHSKSFFHLHKMFHANFTFYSYCSF